MAYRIQEADLKTQQQKDALEGFRKSTDKYALLGGTTYKFSIWAIRYKGGIVIYRTSFDFSGRWVKAQCRPWNQI